MNGHGEKWQKSLEYILILLSAIDCVEYPERKAWKLYWSMQEKVFSPEEKKKMAEKKNAIYIKLLDRMSPGDLEEDVRSTLEQLRNRGCLLAIGSSSKNTRKILDKIGLGNYFDAVCDGNEITHSKPDPEVFLKAAGKIGLAVSECLVVEDACAGISAASAGGFDSAGLGDAAKDKNVTWALNTFGDLKNIVK